MSSVPNATMTESNAGGLHVSRSAERALRLLSIVITGGRISLSESARLGDLSPSTTLRHLKTLELHGFVSRDEQGLFSPGPAFVRLALTALSDSPTAQLIAAVRPFLDSLSATTLESAYLAVREGEVAMYVATSPSPRAVRHVGWISRSVPLEGTAVGVALATDPQEQTPGLPRAAVRIGSTEEGITAVSAPVVTPGHQVVAALSILGPDFRLRGEALSRAKQSVADAASRFGESLGLFSAKDYDREPEGE